MADGGWRTADGAEARYARISSLATAYSLQPKVFASARALSRALLAIGAVLALSACGNIEPWVKPYERQALADPIMSLDPHPISSSYMHHVFEAREGARGALGSAGGGCGCN
jgi:hypothetical protein